MSSTSAQLGRWFDEHGSRLVLYARQCVRGTGAGEGVAEDLVQEVFLRLMEQEVTPGNVKAWLYKAVRNAAISEGKSTRRRGRREMRLAETRGSWFEARVEDLVDASAAQGALERLPAVQREIVVLRIWGQMTLKEVAETVGMPLSSVYDQYKAGLAGVKESMSPAVSSAAPASSSERRGEAGREASKR